MRLLPASLRAAARHGRYRGYVWDPQSIASAIATIATPALALIGIGGRRARLRKEIRENLALIDDIETKPALSDLAMGSAWMKGRVVVDLARLAGHELGTRKKPIQWGSVVLAALLGIGFGLWTYLLNDDGFVWYSVFPGTIAALMLISLLGLFTNRELPPDEGVPQGAVAVRTDDTQEMVANAFAFAAAGGSDERFAPGGQVDVTYQFVEALSEGRFEDAVELADENWLLCRVQAWVWNNREHFGPDENALNAVAERMLRDRGEDEDWRNFLEIESNSFSESWKGYDSSRWGAASHRRRVGRDFDVVLLTPTGSSGGYFVMNATAVPSARTFLLRRTSAGWRIAHHAGAAAPVPGWPPTWWSPDDPFVAALPEA